jgi:PAS domain S-box-containing protein
MFISFRKKLWLILTLAFTIAFCFVIISGMGKRDEEIEAAANNATTMVQSLAAQQEQVAIGIKQTLNTVSLLPAVKNLDADACNKLFRELHEVNTSYTNINAVSPDGTMFAASVPFDNVNLLDRKHFQGASKILDLSAGEYIVGRLSKVSSLNYTFPVLNDKVPVAFVTVGFNLNAFSGFIRKVKLPEGYSFAILDHAGVRLYREPEHPATPLGKAIPKASFEKISSDIDHGTFELTAEDGIKRLYAFRQLRLREGEAPYMYMLIGVPSDKIIQKANSEMVMNLLFLGIAAAISFPLVWFFGKPIARLSAAAQRMGGGDLAVRTSLPHTSDDLGQLAKSFDDMASMLELKSFENRNAEEALRASESKYRNLVETTGTGYLITDQEGRVLDANLEYAKLSGCSSVHEILGRNIVEWTAPYDRERNAEELKRCVADGLTRNLEIDYADSEGRIIPVEINATLSSTAGGAVVICLIKNITERRRAEAELQSAYDGMESMVATRTAELSSANEQLRSEIETRKKVEEALRESEQGFRSLFERHRATMLLVDPHSGAILDVNEAAVKFYGFSKAELCAMNISQINQLSLEEIADARRSILEQKTNSFSFPHRLRNGEIRTVEVYSSPIELEGRTVLFSIVHDITERKSAEDELAQMNEYLENIFNNSPDGIGIVDKRGKFIKWNKMAAEQYGYTFEELGGKSAFDFYADKDELDTMLAELRREGTIKKHEVRMKKRNGTVAHFEISISLLRDYSNEIIGSICVARDLSDIKKALNALEVSHEQLHQEIAVRLQVEAALRESRRELENIIDFLPDATFVINSEGTVIAWNKAIEEVTGIKASDMLGKGDYEYALPFYGERRPILIDLALKSGEEIETKYLYVEKNGEAIIGQGYVPGLKKEGVSPFFVGTARVLRGSDGSMLGAIESMRDFTAIQKAQDELRRTNVEMAQLVASIPSFLIGLTHEHRITRWNRAAEKIFGMTGGKVLGMPIDECGIQWDTQKISEAVDLCRTSNAAMMLDDIRFLRTDEKEGFLGITVSAIEGALNGLPGILLLGNETTQQKILESQLVQAQKLESIGQLAAGIAHEINTPAQYVGDNARFLLEAYGDLERVHDLYDQLLRDLREGKPSEDLVGKIEAAVEEVDLEYIRQEVPKAARQSLEGIERISRIVRAMKDFSHPGTDVKTDIDLNRAIESTVTVARNEWKYVAEMVTDFDPSLPFVPCLPAEINQVVLNIIINASHSVADTLKQNGSEAKGTITISTRDLGEYAEIRILDTGTGIPENIRSKIFDPFFTTKEVGRGTGQGLAISRSVVVDKHGGTITFDSEVGKGTCFVIKLPLNQKGSEK